MPQKSSPSTLRPPPFALRSSPSKEELETLARANDKAKPFLEGKQIAKIIVLIDRLVNFVVK